MTQPPIRSAALRGAVDLSSLGQPPAAKGAPRASGPSGGVAGIRVDATDAAFQEIVLGTREVPALVVLWSSAHNETEAAVDAAVEVAAQLAGRVRVVAVDVQKAPGVARAFQAQQIPVTLGLVAGQPVPLFGGVQQPEQIRPVVDELLRVAAENGVRGTFEVAAGAEDEQAEEAELPPLHQAAFEALERGDMAAAAAAYERALTENPADAEAALGLSQVRLFQRTDGVDPAQARAAAAAAPTDLPAQLLVADLDVLGGHVEDAFGRLIDLVRATADPERGTVRAHLLDLFELVGAHDERVVKARRALMSALF